MKALLENLLPRLKQYSATLERHEVFVDAPWVVIDDNHNQHKYIFRRNGELIMSLNGQVTIGKWEYLESAQSLLIDRVQDKILLNQMFVHPAVMVLKRDGISDDYMVLGNEKLLPKLDAEYYLAQLANQIDSKSKVKAPKKLPELKVLELSSGQKMELTDFKGKYVDTRVTIDGKPVPHAYVELRYEGIKLEITNSKVLRELAIYDYKTDKGVIQVEYEKNGGYFTGDRVFKDGQPAPDGKYKLGFMWHITVKDGRIV